MRTLLADIKVELWGFSLNRKKMSLVTPDLKQEQDGLSSLVVAVGGRGRGGQRDRARGAPRGPAEGPSPPAGELFFLS